MEILIMAGQLLLGLTILVGLHEFGHFITARMFGIRVNKFYIFFDFLFPMPNVLNFALWKKKKGDTEYGLGWFPMGGYVDIKGMIDETKDASQLASTPQPYEFRAKPAWQRLIVMLGGIIINVITGVVIFWILTFQSGYTYLSKDEVNKLGIVAYPIAEQIGLKTGDKILNITGKDFTDFNDIRSSDVMLGENNYYTVDRAGKTIEVPIPNDLVNTLSEDEYDGKFIEPIQEFFIANVAPDTPASEVGLKEQDKIIGFNNQPIQYYHEFVQKANAQAGKPISLQILRGTDTLVVKPTLTPEGKLGFNAGFKMNFEHLDYTLGQSFVEGSSRAFGVITDNIKGFKKIFSGQVDAGKAMSGPIGIARKMYGGVWDWSRFWMITGILSMALAFMNLLPIPALDGGHAVLLIYEMISGRKPSEKFMERTQQVGTLILLTLLVVIMFNDAIKAIF